MQEIDIFQEIDMNHAATVLSRPTASAPAVRARRVGRLAVFLCSCVVSLVVLLGICSPASAQGTLSVFAVDPAAGGSGTVVDVFGQGFDGSADEYFVWVRTPTAGFAFETIATLSGVLSAAVGPVAAADTGVVEVWRGRGHPVADRTIVFGGRLLTAFGSRVFVAHDGAAGPQFTGLVGPADGTLGSLLVDDWLDIDFRPPFLPPTTMVPMIRLTVVIETKSGCSGQTVADVGSSTRGGVVGSRWSFELTIEVDTPFTSAAELAAGVAAMLNRQFADLGVIASPQGGVLRICNDPCIQFGFATVELLGR